MKALESKQIKTATVEKDKDRIESFDGREGNSRAVICHCEGKLSAHTNNSALIAGTIDTVTKGFGRGFVAEMRLMLMETSLQVYTAALGKHKCSLLEIYTKGGSWQIALISPGKCYLNEASSCE